MNKLTEFDFIFRHIIKDLESKLAAKEAMIKALQQHSFDRDSIQHSILGQRPNLSKHTRSVSSNISASLVNAQAQNSSGLITRNLKNLSIAGFSSTPMTRYSDLASSNSASRTSGYSTQSSSSTGSTMINENMIKSSMDSGDALKEFEVNNTRLTDKVYFF